MKFDFQNILIGFILGVISILLITFLISDIEIEVKIGDTKEIEKIEL